MESPRERSSRFIGIRLTARGSAGDLLAHDLPLLLERLKIKKISKRPMVQTSRLPAVDSDAPTTIGAVPVPSTPFHKMAKRPRQVKHQLRTPLQPPNRAVPSDPGSQAPSPPASRVTLRINDHSKTRQKSTPTTLPTPKKHLSNKMED